MSSPKKIELQPEQIRSELDRIHMLFNKRVYVNPDPLVFLYDYPDPGDRELVALIASSLAYGRVAQILNSVRKILDVLGPSPRDFLTRTPGAEIDDALKDFRHRFSSGHEIALLLAGARDAIERYGSLENCFLSGFSLNHENVLPALVKFADAICAEFPEGESYLLPSPERGSACKRVNLMLRWLVRRDDVDPGGWNGIPASKLIVPLDTHMFRIATGLGLTERTSACLRAAVEITKGFAAYAPEDPVKFDFALTRSGIHPEIRKSGDADLC